jgi:hypothetical protein
VANIVAVLFGLHYGGYFNAEEDVVLPRHTSFLVISKRENADGSGCM